MEVLEEGKGELLAWCDPERHREWIYKNKCMEMKDKVTNLHEAISRFVKESSYVTFGGFGHVRTPMAAVYEIIRQKKRNLVVSGKTAVHDIDCLIAGGCVDKVEVAYSFGHELRGLSPVSRRAVETGKVKIAAEWSNAALQWRFKAAASGLPWIPAYVMLGTDTLKYSAAKVAKDPVTGRPICLIPACFPDLAVIHVHRCDKYGNSQIEGSLVMDSEIARAAKRLIITTEEIIPNNMIRDKPWHTNIPFFFVDAVVRVPYGGHPSNMPRRYYFDEEHISEYLKMTRTEAGTEQYLSEYVYGAEDFEQYLELVGGNSKLEYLKQLERGKARFVYPWASDEQKCKPAPKNGYSPTELMIVVASRLLKDAKTVFTGTGMPVLATLLAQNTCAPELAVIYEAGGICPRQPPTLPVSVGDTMTTHKALMASSMDYTMSLIQAGYGDYAFLGAAQLDMHGNINTTVIGPHDKPTVRLPGSGGANDFCSLCRKTIIIMQQDRRKFVENLDFLTTPGYLTGPQARESHGIPRNTGPWRIITQLGVYGFDEKMKLTLLSLHPRVALKDVEEASSFPVNVSSDVSATPEPTEEELRILRGLDPYRIVLRK